MGGAMKLGLIGAGRIGQLHGEIITYNFPEVDIKTVADIFADQAKEWVEKLKIANLTFERCSFVPPRTRMPK